MSLLRWILKPHLVFSKARQLPYAMRSKVEDELKRLVKEGPLEKIDYADWATPIVAVLKRDMKSIRICGEIIG